MEIVLLVIDLLETTLGSFLAVLLALDLLRTTLRIIKVIIESNVTPAKMPMIISNFCFLSANKGKPNKYD